MQIQKKLISDKEFSDYVVDVQVNLESNFTPRYEWLDTVDNDWPKSEYLCGLGLVLFDDI